MRKSARWALVILLGTQLHAVRSEESHTQPAPPTTAAAPVAPSAAPVPSAAAAPAAALPLSCQEPATQSSSLTIRIQLTADAFKRVVFDHPKPAGLPAGVMGQSMVCTCVDTAGNIKDTVKLLRASGSPQLDTEAIEIGRTLSYPTGHPGCTHNTVNFTAP